MTEPSGRTRPMGITILAILAAFLGAFALLAGFTLVAFGSVAGEQSEGLLGRFLVLFGGLFLATGVLQIGFAYGAWNLRPWGWLLGVVGAAIGLAINLLQVIDGRAGSGSPLIAGLVEAGILVYLFTPAVRAAFGRS